MSTDKHRPLGGGEPVQHHTEPCRFRPRLCRQMRCSVKGAFLAPAILGEGGKHDIDREAKMYCARIAIDRHLVGPIDKFADALPISDAGTIFGQRFGNGYIINFLETTRPLTFEGAGAGHKDHWRALTPGFHHCRNSVGKALRADKTDSRFAGDAGMAIGKMAGDLLMRAVDHLHLAFHKAFKRRIAEPAGQGENMFNAFFLKRPCKQGTTPNFFDLTHHPAFSVSPFWLGFFVWFFSASFLWLSFFGFWRHDARWQGCQR